MTSVLFLSLRFLACYVVLLGVLVSSLGNHLVAGAISATAAEVLERCTGYDVDGEIDGDQMHFRVSALQPPPNTWNVHVNSIEHTRNVAMFIAIVLAADWVPRWRPRRGLLAVLFLGTLGLVLVDGLIVAGDAWQTVSGDLPQNAGYQALATIGVYHATGGAGLFAAPVFVGALSVLALRRDSIRPDAPPGRNDPCPCGSGRKWKRCCGA